MQETRDLVEARREVPDVMESETRDHGVEGASAANSSSETRRKTAPSGAFGSMAVTS